MKSILLASVLLLAGFAAQAETLDLQIKGMTCGACVSAVKKKVCVMPQVASCEVEVGKAVITLKDGQKIEEKALSDAITSVGFSLEKMSLKTK